MSARTTAMNKGLTIFVAAFLALSNASVLQQRSLLDEANEQLEQLKSIVQGDIFVAHNQLEDLVTEMQGRIAAATLSSNVNIGKYHAYSIMVSFRNMVQLAQEAGYDVTSCTENREDALNSLPSLYTGKIDNCLQPVDARAVKATQDARYVVDITMSKIYHLENQLNRCTEDAFCISPLITEIELYKIRLPQNIKTEVLATESLFSTMTVSVQSCANSIFADYTTESNTMLKEIGDCINSIMGEESLK